MTSAECKKYIRLNDRVGLAERLEYSRPSAFDVKSVGTPSRIALPSCLGRGKRESGPAILCKTSKLEDRRCSFKGEGEG